jgi:hypothetical protein
MTSLLALTSIGQKIQNVNFVATLGMETIMACTDERKLSVRQSCLAHAHVKRDTLYISQHVSTYHQRFLKTSFLKQNFSSQPDEKMCYISQHGGHVENGTVDRL